MKRSTDKELMDLPGKSVDLFIDDLRHLRQFNRYLGGSRSVIKGLESLVGAKNVTRLSILDVGTGSADIPRAIVRWARGKAVDVKIVAIELDAIAAHEALIQTQDYSEITVIRGDGANAPFHAGRFDVVIASQLLHHFSESDIVAMLRTWSGLAREAILISDLIRHRLAYHGIGLISKLLTRNVMTRVDAPLSVRRAYTLQEWRALFQRAGIGPFRISPMFPFRQLTVIGLGG
jgi:SAM-dependent methyltransferase